jgi:hypothetical protein
VLFLHKIIFHSSLQKKEKITHFRWVQTWHFLTLANHPNFLISLLYLIMYKNCILSFWNFHPFLFLLLLKINLRKWTWKQEKKTKIFVFQPYFELFYHFSHFRKLCKISFKKNYRLIVASINRFFVNFSSILMVLARKGC